MEHTPQCITRVPPAQPQDGLAGPGRSHKATGLTARTDAATTAKDGQLSDAVMFGDDQVNWIIGMISRPFVGWKTELVSRSMVYRFW